MAMTVEELVSGIDAEVIGEKLREVVGLRYGSRYVKPGDAFFCIRGTVVDGHEFAQDAVNRGAKTLFVERMLDLEGAEDVTVVLCANTREAMARAASNFYGNPSTAFSLVGITGTNGKTTTTYLVSHVVDELGGLAGIIGTTGNRVGLVMEHAERTTPESSNLQALFARMRDAGCTAVAMEVSSIGIHLKRPWSTTFAVTAFTNLTQDHLDYHHTFEAYFEAKAALFTADYPAARVVCIDDEWGRRLAERCIAAGDNIITTGFADDADITVVHAEYGQAATSLELSVRGEALKFGYPLVGRFNVSNVMTALGICMQLGFAPAEVARALGNVPGVPGRLDRVQASHDGGVSVYVDYAHTPDALEKAISAVRAFTKGRTIVVFGCGGDRDATKRPLMGGIALAADYAVVTSDNPRTEDPNAIIADVVAGMQEGTDHFEVEPDRRTAIAKAIAYAKPGDGILIAGKGHEDYQILGTVKIDFDDRVVAAEELERRFGDQEA